MISGEDALTTFSRLTAGRLGVKHKRALSSDRDLSQLACGNRDSVNARPVYFSLKLSDV